MRTLIWTDIFQRLINICKICRKFTACLSHYNKTSRQTLCHFRAYPKCGRWECGNRHRKFPIYSVYVHSSASPSRNFLDKKCQSINQAVNQGHEGTRRAALNNNIQLTRAEARVILIFSFSLVGLPLYQPQRKLKHSPSVLHVVFQSSKSTRTFLAKHLPRTPHTQLNRWVCSVVAHSWQNEKLLFDAFFSHHITLLRRNGWSEWKFHNFLSNSLLHFDMSFYSEFEFNQWKVDRHRRAKLNIESRLQFNFQHFRILINFHFIIIYFPLSNSTVFVFIFILSPMRLFFFSLHFLSFSPSRFFCFCQSTILYFHFSTHYRRPTTTSISTHHRLLLFFVIIVIGLHCYASDASFCSLFQLPPLSLSPFSMFHSPVFTHWV